MKRFFIGFVIGILLGGGSVGYYLTKKHEEENRTFSEKAKDAMRDAFESAGEKTREWSDALKNRIDEMDLDADDIRKELAEKGEVVRRKAEDFSSTVAGSASDAKLTATIKSRLALDSDLSAWGISVDTQEGGVTLTGDAETAEEIGKAIALAMDIKGVREVTSKLSVKKKD
jgi:gas vesicle protein